MRLRVNKNREDKFLLMVINRGIGNRSITDSHLSKQTQGLDWGIVVEKGFQNRVASLLYHVLKESDIVDNLPDRYHKILKKFHLETIQWNLRIKNSILTLLEKFKDKEIEPLLLKGVFLAFSVWPSMAMRQMHDIDIVVAREEAKKAFEIIISEGFDFTGKESFNYYMEYTKDFPYFIEKKSGVIVELHHKIFTPNKKFSIDEKIFWENSSKQQFFGRSIRVLGSNDLLIHLCLHVSLGHFMDDMMRSLLDISLLKKCDWYTLDEEQFIEWLDDLKWGPLIALPLLITEKYFNQKWEIGGRRPINVLLGRFTNWKLSILDSAADKFLIKYREKSLIEKLHLRASRTILYNPGYGPIRIVLDFFTVHEGITRKYEKISLFGKIKNNFNRIVRILKLFLRERVK